MQLVYPSFSRAINIMGILALALSFSSPLMAQTMIARWDFNRPDGAFVNASIGSGTASGYGQPTPIPPVTSPMTNGAVKDPGTLIGGTNYNLSYIVANPSLSSPNNSVGTSFAVSTAGYTDPIKISWSQAQSFRASRFWQILVSTNGTNTSSFFAPSGGTGSSISQSITGLNASTNVISGTATVNVNSSGLIDFRTINNHSLSPQIFPTNIPAIYAPGYVDDISFTLPTGLVFENNANFAFASVAAWDPSLSATSGTNGFVSSFAGLTSTNTTTGFLRTGSTFTRLDLMTVSTVPEPSALSLVAIGIGGWVALRRVRRRTD